ncbi:MAG: hypothetical protein ACI9WC_001985 [Arenicella sp.]|jgi:hypothetical protein
MAGRLNSDYDRALNLAEIRPELIQTCCLALAGTEYWQPLILAITVLDIVYRLARHIDNVSTSTLSKRLV